MNETDIDYAASAVQLVREANQMPPGSERDFVMQKAICAELGAIRVNLAEAAAALREVEK